MNSRFSRFYSSALIGTAIFIGASTLALSTGSIDPGHSAVREQSPAQLIRAVVVNELNAEQGDNSMWRFKRVVLEHSGTSVYEVMDTPEGQLQRLVSRNGRPLSSSELEKQDSEINHLASDPGDLHKIAEDERNDVREERRLLEMLPVAFLYTYAGREGQLIKLSFTPDPSFHPQHREGEVFHHMDGSIWIDAPQMRIARLEGRLATEVKFADGILGHLAAGGTFAIEQTDMGDGRWELTRINVNMEGEVLFFKTIGVHQNEHDSDFKSVARDISVEQAAQLLEQNASESSSSPSSPSSYVSPRRLSIFGRSKAPSSGPVADPKPIVFPKNMSNFA